MNPESSSSSFEHQQLYNECLRLLSKSPPQPQEMVRPKVDHADQSTDIDRVMGSLALNGNDIKTLKDTMDIRRDANLMIVITDFLFWLSYHPTQTQIQLSGADMVLIHMITLGFGYLHSQVTTELSRTLDNIIDSFIPPDTISSYKELCNQVDYQVRDHCVAKLKSWDHRFTHDMFGEFFNDVGHMVGYPNWLKEASRDPICAEYYCDPELSDSDLGNDYDLGGQATPYNLQESPVFATLNRPMSSEYRDTIHKSLQNHVDHVFNNLQEEGHLFKGYQEQRSRPFEALILDFYYKLMYCFSKFIIDYGTINPYTLSKENSTIVRRMNQMILMSTEERSRVYQEMCTIDPHVWYYPVSNIDIGTTTTNLERHKGEILNNCKQQAEKCFIALQLARSSDMRRYDYHTNRVNECQHNFDTICQIVDRIDSNICRIPPNSESIICESIPLRDHLSKFSQLSRVCNMISSPSSPPINY